MRSPSDDGSVVTRALVEERAERDRIFDSPMKRRTEGLSVQTPERREQSHSESEISLDLIKKKRTTTTDENRPTSPPPNVPVEELDDFLDAEYNVNDYVNVFVSADFSYPAHITNQIRKKGVIYYNIKWENPMPNKPITQMVRYDYIVGFSKGNKPRGHRRKQPDSSSILPPIKYKPGDEVNVYCGKYDFEATVIAIIQSTVPKYRIKWHSINKGAVAIVCSDMVTGYSDKAKMDERRSRSVSQDALYKIGDKVLANNGQHVFDAKVIEVILGPPLAYRIEWLMHGSNNQKVVSSDKIKCHATEIDKPSSKNSSKSNRSSSVKKTKSLEQRENTPDSEYAIGDDVMAYGGSGTQVFRATVKGITRKKSSYSYTIRWREVFGRCERIIPSRMISHKCIEPFELSLSQQEDHQLYNVGDDVDAYNGCMTFEASIIAVIPGPPLRYKIRWKAPLNRKEVEKVVASNMIKGFVQTQEILSQSSSSSRERKILKKTRKSSSKRKSTSPSVQSSKAKSTEPDSRNGVEVISESKKGTKTPTRSNEEKTHTAKPEPTPTPSPAPIHKTNDSVSSNKERPKPKYSIGDRVMAYYGNQRMEAVVLDIQPGRLAPSYRLEFPMMGAKKSNMSEVHISDIDTPAEDNSSKKQPNRSPEKKPISPTAASVKKSTKVEKKPSSVDKSPKYIPLTPPELPKYSSGDKVQAYRGPCVFEATVIKSLIGPPLKYRIRWTFPLNPKEREVDVLSNMVKELITTKKSVSPEPDLKITSKKPLKRPSPITTIINEKPLYKKGDLIQAYRGPMDFEARVLEVKEGKNLKYQIQWSEINNRSKQLIDSKLIKCLTPSVETTVHVESKSSSESPTKLIYNSGSAVDVFIKGKSGSCEEAVIDSLTSNKQYAITWKKSGKSTTVEQSRIKALSVSLPTSPMSDGSVVELCVAKYKNNEMILVTTSTSSYEAKIEGIYCDPLRYKVRSVLSPFTVNVVTENEISAQIVSSPVATDRKKRTAPNTVAAKKRHQPELYSIDDRVVATQTNGCVNSHATIKTVLGEGNYEVEWDIVNGSKSKIEIIPVKRISGILQLEMDLETTYYPVGTTIIAKQHQLNESRALIIEVLETCPEGKYRVEWETVLPSKTKSRQPSNVVSHKDIYRVDNSNPVVLKLSQTQSKSITDASKVKKTRSTPSPPPQKRSRQEIEKISSSGSTVQRDYDKPKHAIGKSFLINDATAVPSCKIYKIVDIREERGEDSIKVQLLLTSDDSDCHPCINNCPVPPGRRVIETSSAMWVRPTILSEEITIFHVTKIPTLFYVEKKLHKDATFSYINHFDSKNIYFIRKSDGSTGVGRVLSSKITEYVDVQWFIMSEQQSCDEHNCEIPYSRQLIETENTESVHCDQLLPKRIEVVTLKCLEKCFITDGKRLSEDDKTFTDKSHEVELRGVPERVRGQTIFKSFAIGHFNSTIYSVGSCVKFRLKDKYQYGEITSIIKTSETKCYVDISRFNQTGTNTLCRSGYTVRVSPSRITAHINIVSHGYLPPANILTANFETFWLQAPV